MMRRRPAAGADPLLVAAEDPERLDGLAAELREVAPGGAWRAVAPSELLAALAEGPSPRAVLLAAEPADAADPARLDLLAGLVASATAQGHGVILLVRDLPAQAMHRLMRAGAVDFAPVPLPMGALGETLGRLSVARTAAAEPAPGGLGRPRNGQLHAVYGVAGGVGATVYAVNLAWELAVLARKTELKVCLLDLDLQFGAAATYLDLERRDAVFELFSDIDRADASGFRSALSDCGGALSVLTAPADVVPLDLLTPSAVARLIDFARDGFDVVVIDMPRTLTLWTETVLHAAHRFHVVLGSDMRSAQNMLRFLRTLKAEDLPVDKVDPVLNRAPGFGDFAGRGRVRKMAESLGIAYALSLPEGGGAVTQACDQGVPLAEYAAGNALRKEIRKAARTVFDEVQAARTALV